MKTIQIILLFAILSSAFAVTREVDLELGIVTITRDDGLVKELQLPTKDLSTQHGHTKREPRTAPNDEFQEFKSFPEEKTLAKEITEDPYYDQKQFPTRYANLKGSKQYVQDQQIAHGSSKGKIAIMQDSSYIAAGLDNTTTLVYDPQGNVVFSYENAEKCSAIAIAGPYLAIGNPKDDIKIFVPGSWELLYRSSDSYYKIYDVEHISFSYDQNYMAVGNGFYVDTYNTEPWDKDQVNSQGGQDHVTCTAFCRDNKFYASSSANHVQIWEDQGDKWNSVKTVDNIHGTEYNHVDFSQEYMAITTGTKEVDIYEIGSWEKKSSIQVSGDTVFCQFSGNDQHLAISTKNAVYIYEVGSWTLLQSITDKFDEINSMVFSDSKLAVDYQKDSGSYIGIFKYAGSSGAAILFLQYALIAVLFFFMI